MPLPTYELPSGTRVLRGRMVPEEVRICGYAALVHAFDLDVPLPQVLSGSKATFAARTAEGWQLYSPRHLPEASFSGHLTFALRYEPVDLLVLNRLFRTIGPEPVADMVRDAPTGQYARRAWFFYEWLTGTRLDLPDAGPVGYVDALEPDLQIAAPPVNSQRHRVRNNLPGTPAFCPLVTRTPEIDAFMSRDLAQEAAAVIRPIGPDLVARAAAFLLLADSRSSFAIEGENPPQDRLQRWGQAVAQAGSHPLSRDELNRLQRLVISDARFMHMGYRNEGGFVGTHDRDTGAPLPEHVSARPDDLPALMEGLIDFANTRAKELNPVVASAMTAFGFIYIHPFEDGNGRIHRYLIHHQLAASHSARVLPFIQWRETETHNVEITNVTADFYRYFDATRHVAFVFASVARTIEHDLPAEIRFLQRHDVFRRGIERRFDLPARRLELLFRFLHQNNGVLSQRTREREFAVLTEQEATWIEALYAEAFGN